MLLMKYRLEEGHCWALDGGCLPPSLGLSALLELRRGPMLQLLGRLSGGDPAVGRQTAPIDPYQEVWAAGVTYQRSREARQEESTMGDLYDQVYEADRPELFFKALGWRVAGSGTPIRVRPDSRWDVPEPELVLVINRHREIVGYCAGNDASSREIEGQNPLYLPQAKVYTGACALGPGIQLCSGDEITDVPISMQIERNGDVLYSGEASTASLRRSLPDLVEYLTRELDFPQGVFLMTGTCLVPGDDFTLQVGDLVTIQVGELVLVNPVGV